MEATDLMLRAQSQPLQQPAYLSPEARPSAERVNCGHRLLGPCSFPHLLLSEAARLQKECPIGPLAPGSAIAGSRGGGGGM